MLRDWWPFVRELEAEILGVYAEHEAAWDCRSLHGRMHICRALLFAEYMTRFYEEQYGIELDRDAIRLATAFHDSGREDNGTDIWETVSADNCARYVTTHRDRGKEYAAYVGSLIVKKLKTNWDLEKQIVTDADVLEIMRCCGGIRGFQRKQLRFMSGKEPVARNIFHSDHHRDQLIDEAWRWIQDSDTRRESYLSSSKPMHAMLERLQRKVSAFPCLASLALVVDSRQSTVDSY